MTIAAPGVLGNDFRRGRHYVEHGVREHPAHGTLTLMPTVRSHYRPATHEIQRTAGHVTIGPRRNRDARKSGDGDNHIRTMKRRAGGHEGGGDH